ncbi:MAG: low affinity iron permease family protein [Acidobacteriota bacterium]
MARKRRGPVGRALEQFSSVVTRWAGSSSAFGVAVGVILVWIVTGPIFHYSDTWQLVINTGTTVVTFLMVFLIQRAQNKESMAVQLKLNELIAAMEGASNRLIDVEDLNEDELRALHVFYSKLVTMSRKDLKLTQSHSIEEAHERHETKLHDALPDLKKPRH